MSDKQQNQETINELPAEVDLGMTLADFLTSTAPGSVQKIINAWRKRPGSYAEDYVLQLPVIRLFCASEHCGGDRIFDPAREERQLSKEKLETDIVVHYACRNCNGSPKAFALRVFRDPQPSGAHAVKFGEIPRFGPPLPARLRKLADPEIKLLDKGYAAERAGLGIAAFAYYRRVAESLKVRIIEEIIKASKVLNASPEILADLEAAKRETRFTQAVEAVKHGIPEGLYINGHSPLLLLHDALSDHLHDKTDEECLELATIVRVLLAELAEKLAAVFADRKEVEGAVAALLKRKAARGK